MKIQLLREKSVYPAALMVACLGVFLSWMLFHILELQGQENRLKNFEWFAKERMDTIQKGLHDMVHLLEDIRSFYAGSKFVDQEEFRAFTNPMLHRQQGIQALAWVPKISKDQQVQFPVHYVEPLVGNEHILGVDLSLDSEHFSVMQQAQDSGKPVVCEKVTLLRKKDTQFSLFMFYPVYHNGKETETVEQRREQLQGFIAGVFRMEDMIDGFLRGLVPRGVHFTLHNELESGNNFFYVHSSRKSPNKIIIDNGVLKHTNNGLFYTKSFQVASGKWLFEAVPAQIFYKNNIHLHPWIVFGICLLLSTILTIHLIRIKINLIERHQNALKLSDAREYTESLLTSMKDTLLVVSPKGVIQKVNRVETLGYSKEEMIGLPIDHFFVEGEGETLFDETKLESLGQSGLINNTRATMMTKGGHGIPVMVSGSVLRDSEGIVTATILVAKEISDYLKTQSKLRDKEAQLLAADMANRTKSDFLATISHEIRTPMNAIMGLSDLALQQNVDFKVQDYLTKIGNASHSLLRLIDNILDFSKMDAGKLLLEPVDFYLSDLFDHLSGLLENQAEIKQIELILEICDSCPNALKGDSGRVEQILVNLMGNAIKFTETGKISVKANMVETVSDQVIIEFSVKDSGIGITEEQKKTLFDPFVQADGSVTRQYGGTGLGLSICKQLTDKMGGRIWAENNPDGGTLFCFTIPFEKRPELETMEKVKKAPEIVDPSKVAEIIGGARVLVVEDNAINLQVAGEILEGVALVVEIAKNGLEAVQMVNESTYDLVLMDIQMPKMDGYTATRHIRSQPKYAHLPIVAMTAHAMKSDREKCLTVGMNDHLSKPINRKQFYKILIKWIIPREGLGVHVVPNVIHGKVLSIPEKIEGIDVSVLMERLGDNQRLFWSLLREFERDFAQSGEQIQIRMQGQRDNDLESARELIHTIKGMAGNLSAMALFDTALQLEKSIHENRKSEWPTLFNCFNNALHTVLKSIRTLPSTEKLEPVGTLMMVDLVHFKPLFIELVELVESSNMKALGLMDRITPLLNGTMVHKEMQELLDSLDRIDFDRALVSLSAIGQMLGLTEGKS